MSFLNVSIEVVMRSFRPKKFTLKSYKRLFFVFKDTHLSLFRSREETNDPPLLRVNLKGK